MDLVPLIKRVKTLSNSANSMSDSLVLEMLRRAYDLILDTYGLDILEDRYASAVVDLAIVYIDRLGSEGLEAYREGDLSWTYEVGIPEHILNRLLRLNRGKVREL